MESVLTRMPGYPVVGMIGGGQLARMTHAAAIALGVGFRVLAANPLDSAARVVREVVVGDPSDPAVAADFARGCDVITFDHEQVPPPVLEAMEATGTPLRPGAGALVYAQDKIAMRARLDEAGLPCPRWRAVRSPDEVMRFAEEHGWPVVLKTSRGGYDGKGVWVCQDREESEVAMASPLPPSAAWLAEERIDFEQELAAQVARSPSGQAVAYPVVRTVQRNGICHEVVAPAPGLSPDRAVAAQRTALRIAELTGAVGMLAVEMFDDGEHLFVNELAMRPHNSGHWSIEGSTTSQFENHLRAVLDLPLGSPRPRHGWSVMRNVLGGREDLYDTYPHVLARDPALHPHLYGKAVRPGRKVGHVTALGSVLDDVLARARHAGDHMAGAVDG